MKRYELIVVFCTLSFLIMWFFTDNLGGVHFSTSPRLSLDGIEGNDLAVTGQEKEESLRQINEILKQQK